MTYSNTLFITKYYILQILFKSKIKYLKINIATGLFLSIVDLKFEVSMLDNQQQLEIA